MAADDVIARLERQLSQEGLGPVTAASDQLMASMRAQADSILAGLRTTTRNRPLTTLLVALELGYFVGKVSRARVRRRRARDRQLSAVAARA